MASLRESARRLAVLATLAISFLPGKLMADDQYRDFLDAIQAVETGGLDDPWIRTKYMPARGSTAYGPYQVTMGLARGVLEDDSYGLDDDEKVVLEKLVRQQSFASSIGGRDRKSAEATGRFSKEELDKFDYGGTFDFSDAEKKILLSAQEKMVRKTLDDSGGDHSEAARRWHGGAGWNKPSPNNNPQDHIEYSEKVRKKFMSGKPAKKSSTVDKTLPGGRSYR